MSETAELRDALDALEDMVFQYFIDYDDGVLGHSFMSAGEGATETLARLRPHRWKATGSGLLFVGEDRAVAP